MPTSPNVKMVMPAVYYQIPVVMVEKKAPQQI